MNGRCYNTQSYGHIPRQYADLIQRFYTAYFNPYLNFHRPCGYAEVQVDELGRRRRLYRTSRHATPYETLRMLPDGHRYLKEGLNWEVLDRGAYAYSDTEAARRTRKAREGLLRVCKVESPVPPRFA
jgi:hypothetical protein